MKTISRVTISMLFLGLACGLGFGQTLLPNGQQQFSDSNGVPLAGGFVFFYVPNTTTPSPTWKDPTQTTLNSNPVILDSAGRAIIYGLGQYRQVVEDQFSNIVWDNLTQGLPSSLFSNAPAFTLLGNPTSVPASPITIPVGPEFNFVAGTLHLVLPFSSDSSNTTVVSNFNLTQRRATGPFTYTLPKGSTLFNGFGFWVYNLNPGGVLSFSKDAGDVFGGQAFSSSTFSLSPGQVAYIGTDAAPSATWTVWTIPINPEPFKAPQGRLTLTSATPILFNNVVGATSAIYTPYTGNQVPVWNGSTFVSMIFTETTQTLADATLSPASTVASTNYDMFGWVSSGSFVVTRGPAWASATARAAGGGLSLVQGVYTNTTAIVNGPAVGYGVYLGTIHTNAANAVEWLIGGNSNGGTAASFEVYNYYNRRLIAALVNDTATYSYNGGLRQSHNSTGNQISLVTGFGEDVISAFHSATINPTGGGSLATIGVGKDTTTAITDIGGSSGNVGVDTTVSSTDVENNLVGFHVFADIETTFATPVTFSNNALTLYTWQ